MLQVLPDPGPLTPEELLVLTPKEAALLEALRGLFEAIQLPPVPSLAGGIAQVNIGMDGKLQTAPATIPGDKHHHYVTAKNIYLKLRRPQV